MSLEQQEETVGEKSAVMLVIFIHIGREFKETKRRQEKRYPLTKNNLIIQLLSVLNMISA